LQFASANSNTKVVDMVSPAPPYAPSAKFKYEWYQTTSLVMVCILAKATEEEDLKVHFSEHIVIPTKCKYACLKTKLEIKLVKATNIHWMQLGCNTKCEIDWDKLEAIVKEEVGVFQS
jgi:hypothetical protein